MIYHYYLTFFKFAIFVTRLETRIEGGELQGQKIYQKYSNVNAGGSEYSLQFHKMKAYTSFKETRLLLYCILTRSSY